MRIPVLDGPAEGVVVVASELYPGFRPIGFHWSVEGGESVDYTAYPVRWSDSRSVRWVLALDRESVDRYSEALSRRHAYTWRVVGRTDDGEYMFSNHATRETVYVDIDDFWRKQ